MQALKTICRMKKTLNTRIDQIAIAKQLLRWTILTIPLSIIVGSLVALFLWLLDKATDIRWQHEWLLFLLPLAGILIYFLYKAGGKNAEAGNNLIMDEIHEPDAGVPARIRTAARTTRAMRRSLIRVSMGRR